MIERIEHKGKTLGLVLRSSYEAQGVEFVTPDASPLQLGVLMLKQGARIKPHIHRNQPRTITELQEVLYVEYGEVEVGFYSESGEKTASTVLGPGDAILLVSGGHGFDIRGDCKMIEVKQGPFLGTAEDKIRFDMD